MMHNEHHQQQQQPPMSQQQHRLLVQQQQQQQQQQQLIAASRQQQHHHQQHYMPGMFPSSAVASASLYPPAASQAVSNSTAAAFAMFPQHFPPQSHYMHQHQQQPQPHHHHHQAMYQQQLQMQAAAAVAVQPQQNLSPQVHQQRVISSSAATNQSFHHQQQQAIVAAQQQQQQLLIQQQQQQQQQMLIREQQQDQRAHSPMAFSNLPQPIHLAGVHNLTNVLNVLPMPSPLFESAGQLTMVAHPQTQHLARQLLSHNDATLANSIAIALANCDISDIDVKEVYRLHDTDTIDNTTLCELMRTVLLFNSDVFSVPSSITTGAISSSSSSVISHSKSTIGSAPSRVDNVNLVNGQTSAALSGGSVTGSEPNTPATPSSSMTAIATPEYHHSSSSSTRVDQSQLRQQIVSVGKQPKAHARRKKDMVSELFDSLTPAAEYFDPGSRRRRVQTRTYEDELLEKQQLAEIETAHCSTSNGASVPINTTVASNSTIDDFSFERIAMVPPTHSNDIDRCLSPVSYKRAKKRSRNESSTAEDVDVKEEVERPVTPQEVINRRDDEWHEKQRKRQEKHKRRKNDADYCDKEAMAEEETYRMFTERIDQIFDNCEDLDIADDDDEIPQELLIAKSTLDELRREAQKLKSWGMTNKVNADRLVKLLTILEKNIRDVTQYSDGAHPLVPFFDDREEDEYDETFRELVDERILRAADAACAAMMIVTSPKMPKQVFIEDTIDRSIQLTKQFLHSIIYPAYDVTYRSTKEQQRTEKAAAAKKANADEKTPRSRVRKSTNTNSNRSRTVQCVYARMTDVIGCFAELARSQTLTETSVLQLASLAIAPFFVDNIAEMQMQSLKLATVIFAKYDQFRRMILQELLGSLHRLPSTKNAKNSYRMSSDEWVNNLTILVMQLVQASIKIPRKKKHTNVDTSIGMDDFRPSNQLSSIGGDEPDLVVIKSFDESANNASLFLGGFLSKCTAKSEEDYRRLFDLFLHDLLVALYKPEWPAAEIMLQILANILVKHYRSKQLDMSLRIASLDYLGTITARLRRDSRGCQTDETRLNAIIDSNPDDQYACDTKYNNTELSHRDKIRKLEQALIDYLVVSKADGDVSVEYAVKFYVAQWYKETSNKLEKSRKTIGSGSTNDDDRTDKDEHAIEIANSTKHSLLKLVDRKRMRRRGDILKRNGRLLSDDDASWVVKYLASRRKFSQSFQHYLQHILFGVRSESAVGIRTKAMRCLTMIIEADHEVLLMPEVQNTVQSRMVDPNSSVREATTELVGKYLMARPDLIPKYYPMFADRILDTGVSVRKRVIRIMKDMCEKRPDFDKIPEICSKIIRRINDEEGIRKIVIETFQSLWFQPVKERDSAALLKKVVTITDVVQACYRDCSLESLETLLGSLLKTGDRSVVTSSKQLVDCLVENILTLEEKMAGDNSVITGASNEARSSQHQRLLSCLTTLYLFSKVRPELLVNHAETMQPYLSMSISGQLEQQVLNQVINIIERVVPLMDHPSETFINQLESDLMKLIKNSQMAIIQSALACMSASVSKQKRSPKLVLQHFGALLNYLTNCKSHIGSQTDQMVTSDRRPTLLRSLFTLGLMCRYFDFDQIVNNPLSSPSGGDKSKKTIESQNDRVYLLLSFFARNRDEDVRFKSFVALGNFCARHGAYLMREDMKNMYITLLLGSNQSYLKLKVQALKNIELFLLAEESKMVKGYDEWQKAKDGQDLKEMDTTASGLGSTVIQLYWNQTLQCYFNPDVEVRKAAVQVTALTLSQGLVTPGSSIPTLISMSTDPSSLIIRNKVETILKEIDSKYGGMVPSKAIAGVRQAFRLQKVIMGERAIVRGIRRCEPGGAALISSTDGGDEYVQSLNASLLPEMSNDAQAVLNGLYQSLRTNRQQRRSFLSNLLRLFDESSKCPLEELIFVADNIAMLPYQVLDEPLYVIHHADAVISVSGLSLVQSFKERLLPKYSNNGEIIELDDDDVELIPEKIYSRLPCEMDHLYECITGSQACFLLLYLKSFLKSLYGIAEAKLQEYSPSESAKVYEKAVSRRNVAMFRPDSALQELDPRVRQNRDEFDGRFRLCQQFCQFRQMMLSLDQQHEQEEHDLDSSINAAGSNTLLDIS